MASCFALTGFAIAIVSGLRSGGEAVRVIEGALFALVICYGAGLFAGRACAAITREHMRAVEKQRPVRDASPFAGTVSQMAQTDGSAQEAEAA
ncbi:MAG: hypothetical protein Tsb0013_18340 [Phycisphaerales bacterium]